MSDACQGHAARLIDPRSRRDVLALCALVPESAVFVAAQIERTLGEYGESPAGDLWGWPSEGPPRALCWAGANIVPVVPPDLDVHDRRVALRAFAQAVGSASGFASLTGDESSVLTLWSHLSGQWPAAREIRRGQPLLAINRDPDVEPDPWVRITAPSEIPLVLPACVAMFTHEVGYSPITEESTAYVGHVTSIVERGYSFSRFAGANSRSQSAVEFTAELGAVALDVAQVQGVWVAPHLRGTGLSAPALAAVVAHTRAHIARTLCLYANSHNVPALRTYARVGYERVGTFATVLF